MSGSPVELPLSELVPSVVVVPLVVDSIVVLLPVESVAALVPVVLEDAVPPVSAGPVEPELLPGPGARPVDGADVGPDVVEPVAVVVGASASPPDPVQPTIEASSTAKAHFIRTIPRIPLYPT